MTSTFAIFYTQTFHWNTGALCVCACVCSMKWEASRLTNTDEPRVVSPTRRILFIFSLCSPRSPLRPPFLFFSIIETSNDPHQTLLTYVHFFLHFLYVINTAMHAIYSKHCTMDSSGICSSVSRSSTQDG